MNMLEHAGENARVMMRTDIIEARRALFGETT